MTNNVAGWARVAGTWEACEVIIKHPSTGFWSDFSGPLEKSYVRVAGTWEVFATDLENGLSTSTAQRSVFDFDFNSPWYTEAGMRISFDGRMLEKSGNSSYDGSDVSWLSYRNMHGLWQYFVYFDNPGHSLDSVPASLTTKKEVSLNSQTFASINNTFGTEEGEFVASFGDWNSPEPAQVHLSFVLRVTAENNNF